jgi:antitoxin CcdA
MSTALFDTNAPKTTIRLGINSDLLRQAKALNIKFSQVAELAITDAVRKAKSQKWREENRDAIAAYNRRIEKEGLALEEYRMF